MTVMSRERYRKVALVGYPGVGKTVMAEQFVQGIFTDSYFPTVLNEYHKPAYQFNNAKYNLQIVDTAGQTECSNVSSCMSLVSMYGFVLVYSIDSLKSFHVVEDLAEQILEYTGWKDVPIVIVGNKLDLSEQSREVDYSFGTNLTRIFSNAEFLEISAKNTRCVEKVFQKLLRRMEKVQNGPLHSNSAAEKLHKMSEKQCAIM